MRLRGCEQLLRARGSSWHLELNFARPWERRDIFDGKCRHDIDCHEDHRVDEARVWPFVFIFVVERLKKSRCDNGDGKSVAFSVEDFQPSGYKSSKPRGKLLKRSYITLREALPIVLSSQGSSSASALSLSVFSESNIRVRYVLPKLTSDVEDLLPSVSGASEDDVSVRVRYLSSNMASLLARPVVDIGRRGLLI
jgi:hypothetical protein